MNLTSIILLGLALAMDAFSVAVTDGMVVKSIRICDALKIGLFFGTFQFVMPFIGLLLSALAYDYIINVDHWIAFFVLAFLGLHMIIEAHSIQEIPQNPLKTSTLTAMAIATSIDALAAGITLASPDMPFLLPCTIIGITAFLFSFCGVFIGKHFGNLLGSKAETAGGIILILLGTKTLIEHLCI